MARVVNTETLELRRSVNTPEYVAPWVVVDEAVADAVALIPTAYRKWVVDHVEEMSAGEKAAVDAAALVAADDSRMSQFDQRDALAAFALLVLDEVNILRAQHGLAARTVAQIKSGIRTKLEAL